jgi:hypothetical protein
MGPPSCERVLYTCCDDVVQESNPKNKTHMQQTLLEFSKSKESQEKLNLLDRIIIFTPLIYTTITHTLGVGPYMWVSHIMCTIIVHQ